MKAHHVPGVSIAGISCAVPRNVVKNEDQRIVRGLGVAERRHVTNAENLLTCAGIASDHILSELGWRRDTVDALVFVTQTAPRRMPSISCELHSMLDLTESTPAFDLNMACSGYAYGLWVAASLRLPRVLLVVGDTISRFLDATDSGTWPIFGDAVSATALEHEDAYGLTFIGGTDGSGAESLKLSEGVFADYLGNVDPILSSKAILQMDGQAVFNFALSTVPGLVAEVTQNGYVDHYLFHQANAAMIAHLAKKCSLDNTKVPMNIAKYGNCSSASIPLLMCDSGATESLRTRKNRIAMFGFGAGFSWGGILTDTEPMPLSVVEV